MSIWNDNADKRRERRQEQRREYEADVVFEVWSLGGNPDQIDMDRVDDNFADGIFSDDAATEEMRSQRRKQPEPEIDEQGEMYGGH